jgi:hypothetical protein
MWHDRRRTARVLLTALCFSLPVVGHAETPTRNEIQTVANNWVNFILARDGNWGGERNPSVGMVREFTRGDVLLGYYVPVLPQGFLVISLLKDLAPIKAYSTTNSLDPYDEVGMCALLKRSMQHRLESLIRGFGSLEAAHMQLSHTRGFDANRAAWSCLLVGGSALRTNLQSINVSGGGPVGPLLKTRWHQNAPYNDLAPIGYRGTQSAAGCTAIALAQVMKYYCWPPHGEGDNRYYWNGDNSCPEGELSFGDNLYADFSDSYDWVNMPDSTATTTAQKSAVARLCYEVAVAVEMDFGSCGSAAPACGSLGRKDARGALEDYFYYNTPGNTPACEDRDDYTWIEWWNIIKDEIDHNRPVIYHIVTTADDSKHNFVVDGYDNSAGIYTVHANYGYNNKLTTWYTLDGFECDYLTDAHDGCDYLQESLIRYIYPREGLFGPSSGVLQGGYYSYIYGDVTSSNLMVQAGANVQFLGGTSGTHVTCTADSIRISGSTSANTRLFSHGDLSKGVKLTGAHIVLRAKGSINVH